MNEHLYRKDDKFGIIYGLVFVGGICILMYGCLRDQYEYKPIENHKVVKVFIRNPGEYLVISGENSLQEDYVHGQIFMDVPSDKKCWYKGQEKFVRGYKFRNAIVGAEIHIHGQSEIGGGRSGGKYPVENKEVE